jgi:hypothetical protein
MSAQTFLGPSFRQAGVHLPNFPGVVQRTSVLDLDTLIGLTDGTAATTLEANDLIKVFKLPANCKIVFGRIDCEDLDGHATPTLTLDLLVSDGSTTKYIFDEATIGQSGGFADSRDAGAAGVLDIFDSNSAINYVLPDNEIDWYVGLKVGTAAATMQNDAIAVTIGYTHALENVDYDRDFPTPNP